MKTNIKEIKTFGTRFWWILFFFCIAIGIILFFPYWFTNFSWNEIDFSHTGEIGDTIGGILGPFIELAAAILTFLAFWVQYIANEQQKQDLKIERFENKFYELIRLHQSNVEEMKIGENISGRKAFVHMFYELRYCYIATKDFFDSTPADIKAEYEYSKINLMSLAFKIFFWGLGFHSEKNFVWQLGLGEKHLFFRIKGFLEGVIQASYIDFFDKNPSKKYYTHGLTGSGLPDDRTIEFFYFPFDGHSNKLGHYYRHLFQTANYIIEQPFLSRDSKYEYVKTLRAQMTNFEQLLLYYNSVAWFDEEWRELFTTYRLIKNIPLPLADFHIKPEVHYKKEIEELQKEGITMFEWHE